MYNPLIKIKISGKDVKRFLKKIYKKGIYFQDIEVYKKYAYITLTRDNYNKIKIVKTSYNIEIIRLYGILKIIETIKKFKLLIICLILGYFYIIFLSNIIMDVEVIHSKKNIRDIIYNELSINNIKKFRFIKSFDKKEQIENTILENHKDLIEWIEIERVGTKYIVRLEERVIRKPKKENILRNVIAKKDGIVKKIEATHGEVLKKKNDYVKKGDVIISGIIKRNDNIKNVISAEGICYAEVWYKVSIDMPFYYSETNYTKNKKNVLKIKILDKSFYFFNFNKYKTFLENEILSLNNKLLPIKIVFSKENETIIKEQFYTKENAIKEAEKLSLLKMKKTLAKDEKILKSKIISTIEYENYIKVEVFYKVYENITGYESLNKEEILKSTNTES